MDDEMEDGLAESGFCTECGFKVDSFKGLNGCPSCGDVGVPCTDKNQVQVSINWHELRILCMWAEHWQGQMKDKPTKVVYAIAKRLSAQFPERDPLTMAVEIGDVMKEFPDLSVLDPKLRENIIEQTGQEPGLF